MGEKPCSTGPSSAPACAAREQSSGSRDASGPITAATAPPSESVFLCEGPIRTSCASDASKVQGSPDANSACASQRGCCAQSTAKTCASSQGTAPYVSVKSTPKGTPTSGASQVSCELNKSEDDEYDECRERVEKLDGKYMDEEDLCDCCVTYMFSSQPATYRSSLESFRSTYQSVVNRLRKCCVAVQSRCCSTPASGDCCITSCEKDLPNEKQKVSPHPRRQLHQLTSNESAREGIDSGSTVVRFHLAGADCANCLNYRHSHRHF
ncbi:hypothetical protein P389DRAFT_28601 [Cystobasidium minutum MCA 4210]|uniref:uncharacterized protein n=1 Tax=Cystobasidium minutum MCA 4210 TaxID=1397322 RepID=UPI0034CDB4FA|eukprot:jgi/Rhomi1/28601/CE28600_15085